MEISTIQDDNGLDGTHRELKRAPSAFASMSPYAALLITVGLVAAGAVACTAQSPSSAPDTVSGPMLVNTYSMDAQVDDATPDAQGSLSPKAYVGSPLCNAARWRGCYPDDLAPAKPSDCAMGSDGGTDDATAGSDNGLLACRVQPAHGDAGVQPGCASAGMSTDDGLCSDSADCAPGYECIARGVCRRYCCAGECASQDQFCDIQWMAGGNATRVPVCMPIRACALLPNAPDTCGRSESCAVVRDNGTAGCVANGGRQAGEECDTGHCARGLVCLGTPGARRCYILCRTAPGGTECASTPKQTCMGGLPLFPSPGVGICE
jgi:hypothetical protein